MKEIPQLGLIRVKRNLSKSRYDYIVLQLYLHKLIRHNLQDELERTYNNKINPVEFMQDKIKIAKIKDLLLEIYYSC